MASTPASGVADVDHKSVSTIRREVGSRLQAEQVRRRSQNLEELTGVAERQFARHLTSVVIGEHAGQRMDKGEAPLDTAVEQQLSEAVYASMFAAGALQALLDDKDLEEIDVNGCDEVWVTRAGAAYAEPAHPVASSDEELRKLISSLASYAGLNSRPWDEANPELDLQLQDGSRLSAVMSVTERPSIAIRRHRFEKVTLEDLVGNDTMTVEVAEFLTALTHARLNVMIGGATKAGKTTLLRAHASAIDPRERIITIEKARELGLRKNRELHPNCVEFEERIPNAEGLGAVSIRQLVRRTLRQNPDRVIVGEVLGPEIIDMLNAMSQGNDGSMSTIHCRSARDAFDRMATYAIQAEERLPHEATYRLIAGALDYIVFIKRDLQTGNRRVETVLEINGYDDGRVLSSEIFTVRRGGTHAEWTGTPPARLDELTAAGWTMPGAGERGW
ncbi:MAG: ATPase, T2SS/T4P/T4SS family [Propionibacteriales bacterium]|nr:ATPase, T2SS/T4P/T4SS family [Propionibacteriales bacterium]